MFRQTDHTLSSLWHGHTLQALEHFVSIPSRSPLFDPSWESHKYLLQALQFACEFGQSLFPEARFEVLESPGKTPLLFFELEASGKSDDKDAVLFYGHLDKQPEASGWGAGRAPFKASHEGNILYGRGAADDGYSVFAALSVIHAMRTGSLPHPKIFGLFETCEESGSYDFSFWVNRLQSRIGSIGLAVILDSGCIDYDRLCITTNFRGLVCATLKVSVLAHGVHSGTASGLVPDSFMIARQLLDRLEDSTSGKLHPKAFYTEIPPVRRKQVEAKASLLKTLDGVFPWLEQPALRFHNLTDGLIAQTWLPQLAITGANGLPEIANAGNVLRAGTALRLSLRTPPCVDATLALDTLRETLLAQPPFGARVELTDEAAYDGWNAQPEQPWFAEAVETASQEIFGQSAVYSGEGGSLSIFDVLQGAWPNAQFFLTGVLGPQANAHGPDEALRLDYAEKLCRAVARVIVKMP